MTPSEVLNQYPSTDDMPPIMGAQDDPVLLILQGARKRYKRGATSLAYQDRGGRCCAMGALGAAAGIPSTGPKSYYELGYWEGYQKFLDTRIDNAAKEAIKLVNKACVKLFPEFRAFRKNTDWSWPLEWLNQSKERDYDFAATKAKVLSCYDYAIEMRTAGTW